MVQVDRGWAGLELRLQLRGRVGRGSGGVWLAASRFAQLTGPARTLRYNRSVAAPMLRTRTETICVPQDVGD